MSYLPIIGLGAAFAIGLTWWWIRNRRHQNVDVKHALADGYEGLLWALDRIIDGDLAAAYDVLAQVAKETNSRPEVYFALASLLRSMGRHKRAAQVYRTILVRPNLDERLANRARVGLAEAFVQMGRAADARAVIEELPKKLRSEVGLLDLRKRAAVQNRDWQSALSASDALAKAEGHNGELRAEAYARIAEQAAAQGDDEAAYGAFRKALKSQPGSIRARKGLANLYIAKGKVSKARRQLMAALQANPALAPILLPKLRSTIVLDKGSDSRFDDLIEHLDSHPGLHLWAGLERADRLYQNEKVDECRMLLEQLLHDHPRSVEAHEATINLLTEIEDERALGRAIENLIDLASEEIQRFRCGRCGYLSSSPFMDCPHCGEVGALVYQG